MGDSKPHISLKELKGNLKQALLQSGALDEVKAQIRKDFIETITTIDNASVSTRRIEKSLQSRITIRPKVV